MTQSNDAAGPKGGGFAIATAEFQGLYGAGPLGMAIYMVLRAAMDFNTGLVGVSTPISLHGLAAACERHIRRGQGYQRVMPSEKDVRMALDALTALSAIERHGNAECLAFRLVRARVGPQGASVRPFQTGHGAGANAGTNAGGLKLIAGAGLQDEPGTDAGGNDPPNRAHIRDSGVLLSTSRAANLYRRKAAVDKHAAAEEISTMATAKVARLILILQAEGLQVLSNSPQVRRWASSGVNERALKGAISEAHKRREKAGSAAPINLGLIEAILSDDAKAVEARWAQRAQAVGLTARAGESWADFRRRVVAAEESGHG